MKTKLKKMTAAMMLLLAMTAAAFSQPMGPGGPGGPGQEKDLPPMLIKKLGLTEEQKEKVQSIRSGAEKEKIRVQAELQIKQIDLQEELEKKTVSEKKVDKLIDDIAQLQKKMLENKIKTMLALKKVLTPQQQEKLKNFMDLKKGQQWSPGGPGFQGGNGMKMNKMMKKKNKQQPGMNNFEGGPGEPGFQGPMKNKMMFNPDTENQDDMEDEAMMAPPSHEMSFMDEEMF